ncbi:MAG: hypothetical protein LWX83_19230 [Anaerolineae bacterium]|nr:hypothetical protein [Anaerolineae bacterium]
MLKNKMLKTAALLLIVYLGTTGLTLPASPAVNPPENRAVNPSENCIPPVVTVAYPVEIRNVNDNHATDAYDFDAEAIPPVKPWIKEASLPWRNPDGKVFQGRIILSRSYQRDQEIWFSGFYGIVKYVSPSNFEGYFEEYDEEREYKFLIYNSGTKEWTFVDRQINPTKEYIFDVFSDKKGSVWGLASADVDRENLDLPITLVKYNEKQNTFEIPVSDERPVVEYTPEKLIDATGNYWFYAPYPAITGLYRYNLKSGEIKKYNKVETSKYFGGFISMQITRNGELLIRAYSTRDLIHFDPKTETVRLEFVLPLEDDLLGVSKYLDWENYTISMGTDMYLDKTGRLWVEDYGWKEPNGTWYKLIKRTPDFIAAEEGPVKVVWNRPTPVLRDREGMMWFIGSYHGLTRLNPETGEWCKMTSMSVSKMVEDTNGTIWMEAGWSLYKYEMGL